MDHSFRQGFEKTALLGGLARTGMKAMPKIFKWATHKQGKFSAGKALGTSLTGAFGLSTVKDVGQKVKNVSNHLNYQMMNARANFGRDFIPNY